MLKMAMELASNESIDSQRINNIKSTLRLGSMIVRPPKAYALQMSKKNNDKSKHLVNQSIQPFKKEGE